MSNEQPNNGADEQSVSPNEEAELRASLEPFADVLRSASTWESPPPGLDGRVLAAIRSAPPPPAEFEQAAPSTSRAGASRRAATPRWWFPAVAAAAAVVAFGAGLVLGNGGDDDGDDAAGAIAEFALSGTDRAPEAGAAGHVFDRGAGYAIRLEMVGLAPAPDGEYYEGWLGDADGALVSVGTFHMRNGDDTVVLWSGVPIARYRTLIVTAEVEDTDPAASEEVVLEGELRRL